MREITLNVPPFSDFEKIPWDPGSQNPNLLHVWRHLTYNFYLDTTKRQPGWFISIHFKFWVD